MEKVTSPSSFSLPPRATIACSRIVSWSTFEISLLALENIARVLNTITDAVTKNLKNFDLIEKPYIELN